jgi:hypothetical protein
LIREGNGLKSIVALKVFCTRNGELLERCQAIFIGHSTGNFLEILVERRDGRFVHRLAVCQIRRSNDGSGLCELARQRDLVR